MRSHAMDRKKCLGKTGAGMAWALAVMGCLVIAPPARAQTTLYTLNGDSPADSFGWSVSGAGDVNRDGIPDLIAGAYLDDNNGTDSGSARVFSGADGSVLYTFNGDSPGDWFGISVSGAGDVNDDGYADLIVGARLDDNNGAASGSARVFSGFDGSVLYTFDGDSINDVFGSSVSGAGDVNADGYADLIVGAPGDDNNGAGSGSARVFSGVDGSVLYTFHGDSALDTLGLFVSDAGDVNNDGFADVIVGAPFDDNNGNRSGTARVFSGIDGSILHSFVGDDPEDWLGTAVSAAGDVDGDGFADLLVGAFRDGTNGVDSGSVRVFSGFDGSILYTFLGDSAGHLLGFAVDGVGDVDGDGFADLMLGAFSDDTNGADAGGARVISGRTGSILYTLLGDSAGDWFGLSVSGVGDVDGDGYPDLIVGAPNDDNNGTNSGSARVISGRPDPLLLLEQLIQDVMDLNLQQGINNSLDAKLDAVIQALQDVNENNDVAAINALQAFINAVQAQSGNHIPVADADALIATAQAIIDLLSAA